MKKLLPLILSLLIVSSIAWSQPTQTPQNLQLADIYKRYKFFPRGIDNLNSMNDGNFYTLLKNGRTIERYSYKTGLSVETIFDLSTIEGHEISTIESYTFSPDESLLLLVTGKENIYRHSFVAGYYIYDIKSKELKKLSDNGKQQLATFSPDSKKIAFVRRNNLFYTDLHTHTEHQITTDGEYNKIINGAPDWVYEEEFGFNKAFVWSVDSRHIAWYRFDESDVKQFNMTMYHDLYPEWYRFKYPKAGEKNAVVEILATALGSETILKFDIGEETDQYIPRIKWTSDPELLSIVRLNRRQNHVEILHANVHTGESRVIYEEKEDKYISEVSDQMITYLSNNEEMLIISERDSWSSIYLYNYKTSEIKQLTESGYDIHTLLGVDEKKGLLYYSSHERDPLYLDSYSVKLDGSDKKLLTPKKGWNVTDFSKGFNYFINTWSNANTPPVISLHKKSGQEIRVLEDNSSLAQRMKDYQFAETEFFSYKTKDNFDLQGYMIKPPNFNPQNKYPLFMFVYGGPESQNVMDRFNYSRGAWFQYLAQQGYVVVCVDNRGTNGQGEDFRKATYMQLGKYETIDQIEVAEYLGEKDFIDESRVGIFGWSYGGFMSLNCLFKGAEIFNMAISVAPVTNWRYYDTIYTERFMRTPQENPDGYDSNSPIFFTDRMRGKLLLIHGMGDDNVHFQNSVELMKALVKSDKQFDSRFYPNKNHGIHGGNTTWHLYNKMTDYILENL